MGTNQDYKNRALASLKGNWGNAIGAYLFSWAVSIGINLIVFFTCRVIGYQGDFGRIITHILYLPFSWGLTVYFLDLVREDNTNNYNRLFDGYFDWRVPVTMIISGILIFIGAMFLIVPGIIIAISLSQTNYILKDDYDIGVFDAMKKSFSMMKKHLEDYVLLCLSFIGWGILAICTCCIGFIALMPYWNTTMAHYYEDLKAEYEQLNNVETESPLD